MDEPTLYRPANSIRSFFLWSTRFPEEIFMKAGFGNMSLEVQRQFRQNWISHRKALAETIRVNKELKKLFRLARLQVRIEDRQALEKQAHTLRQNARY